MPGLHRDVAESRSAGAGQALPETLPVVLVAHAFAAFEHVLHGGVRAAFNSDADECIVVQITCRVDLLPGTQIHLFALVPFEPAQYAARPRASRRRVAFDEAEPDRLALAHEVEHVRVERQGTLLERGFHLPEVIAQGVRDVRIGRGDVARHGEEFAQGQTAAAVVGRQAQRAEAERLQRGDLFMRQALLALALRRRRGDPAYRFGEPERGGQGRDECDRAGAEGGGFRHAHSRS